MKKRLDEPVIVCYSYVAGAERRFFFTYFYMNICAEVNIMRTRITLACTECKNRNYDTTKDKKAHPDRMETKKYCRFCKKHTMHKETK